MKAIARSTPNIALIKYWGNRNDARRLPAGDSLSITLDGPIVEVSAEPAEAFAVRSLLEDGSPKILEEKDIARFARHYALIQEYLETLRLASALPAAIALEIVSQIPSGIGLASSAAVFSATAKAVTGLLPHGSLTDEQISVLARLGSGSAARSIFGGYVAMHAALSDDLDASVAEQIAPPEHWLLTDIIIAPSIDHKKVGSTEGHAGAATSPYFPARLEAIRTRRQRTCIEAILARDFEKLKHVVEEDALDMHHVMETQQPALEYLTADTHRIIAEIQELREREHLPVLYTMDAGPTVHLICEEEAVERIKAYTELQTGFSIFQARVGNGTRLI